MSSKSITVEGSIHAIGDVATLGAKGFQKREVVILVEDGKFPQHVPVEFTGDKINAIDGYGVGDLIAIECNVRGREWSGANGKKYFLSLAAWKINGEKPAAKPGGSHGTAPTHSTTAQDDIPF